MVGARIPRERCDRFKRDASQPPIDRRHAAACSARFHDSRVRAVPADADRRAAGRPLIDGFPGADPLALADATLFLPTRRACALARDVFLDVLEDDAAVLPRIVPLGDIDEDELAFADMANGAEALEIPDALGGLERRMLLAQLVLKWIASPSLRTGSGQPLVANSPASALALADALARLIDDMTTRQVRVEPARRRSCRDEYDEYWQLTLEFLQDRARVLAGDLDEQGKIDPAARRDLLIEAERNAARQRMAAR